ncbi:type 3 dihydrofolate reductase [Algicola sagamiensis]|uniref:type 3 dihydrofolate reductase n=1 Tax=Algicola sagamiensis TaxID=163869 RepID=UPI00036034A3|nr:type 3 dihydrofolate reductase [Algicola sagamiensis]
MKISLIVAMDENRVIGLDNQMPWHLPADLKHFKSVTMGKPIVMGRKTFESIGRPLPGRENVVLTRSQDYQPEGVTVCHSKDELLSRLQSYEEVMIIGGGNIYQQFLQEAETLYLTQIHASFNGDTFFPDYTAVGNWVVNAREDYERDEKNTHDYSFLELSRTL